MSERFNHRAIETIWQMESPKLVARLTGILRDVGLAEDLAQDALVIALERWPLEGIPPQPGAWLMITAKRKAIDLLRRNKMRDRKYEELAVHTPLYAEEEWSGDEEIGDDLLRLVMMTCHPVLSQESRVALTLRLLCGLSTDEIARATMSAESAVAQRIVRAKKTLKQKNVRFDLPEGPERLKRLSSVLEVLYLMFNEGYAATSGKHWTKPTLCLEALRLGRILAEIAPKEPEVHGLVALMEVQTSRLRTREGSAGEAILLLDQNRYLWDRLHIRRGMAALERCKAIGGRLGPYALQASIAACHAEALDPADTNWIRIAALYEALSQAAPSYIVELNRAVALSMAFGPEVGLQLVDMLRQEAALQHYYLLPAVRGDMLVKLGRWEEAVGEFRIAASLTRNEEEKRLMLKRADECGSTDLSAK